MAAAATLHGRECRIILHATGADVANLLPFDPELS